MEDFEKGVLYLPGNKEAEVCLVILAVRATDAADVDKLMAIEPKDFAYDDTRFVFTEVQNMRKADQPMADGAAFVSWFRRPEVVRRMKEARLRDWFNNSDYNDQPNSWAMIYEMVSGGEDYASYAHLDWYAKELRSWRIKRGLRLLAMEVDHSSYHMDPLPALEQVDLMTSQLKELAKPLRTSDSSPVNP